MESLINALSPYLGDGLLLGVVVAILYVANSGLVPWLFGQRQRAAQERDKLIEHYAKEAEDVRRWRAEDEARHKAEIKARDDRIDKLIEASVLSERGNSRLRHALNNIMQVVVGQYDLAIGRGERPPFPVEGMRNLFGLSDDLDEKLRHLFREVGAPPPDAPLC